MWEEETEIGEIMWKKDIETRITAFNEVFSIYLKLDSYLYISLYFLNLLMIEEEIKTI